MTELNTHSKIKITNVSRRGLLKGVAATGGLALAVQFPAVRGALAAYPTGADAMPNGVVSNPRCSSRSAATARSASSRPAPRWATVPRAPRCP